MNVMIAANYSAPKSGNFIPSLIALGRLLVCQGWSVVYVMPDHRDWEKWIREEGFEIVITGRQALESENQFETLKTLLDKYRIDILHLHFGIFHHAVLRNRRAIKDVKIIIHDHMGYSVQSDIRKQRLKLAFHSLEYAIKDISLIAVQKKKLENYIFLRNKWYIANGLSMERYIEHSMTREECRETFDIKPSDKVCLLLGWDMKLKGLDVALKAIKKCREKDTDIVLGVIGIGHGSPTDSAKKFIEREAPDIEPSEPWIKYLDSYEDIFAVYRAVDVYLMASRKEGFPYSLLESISQDTPTVISDIQENQFARKYSNAFYYPVEDVDACAEAIIEALQKGRVKTNSSEFLKKYRIDMWCKKVLKVYEMV